MMFIFGMRYEKHSDIMTLRCGENVPVREEGEGDGGAGRF